MIEPYFQTRRIQILDSCCGSKMFWFDKKNQNAVYMDRRRERHILKDISSRGGYRDLIIEPDIQADFKALPFRDNHFSLVVFDPPHLLNAGDSSWMAKKYGKLNKEWQEEIRAGFAEAFRVLRPGGTLIFKWAERAIQVKKILALTPQRPLFGNNGKTNKTHWIVFMKQAKDLRETRQIPIFQGAERIDN